MGGFIQSHFQMSIWWGGNDVLSYVDYCVYWYTLKALGKCFVDTLGKRFHINLLGYAHFFMPIRSSQMKYHYISVYEARHDTSIIAKYLDTDTVKTSTNFYKNNLPSDIIFTKPDASTRDDKIEKLTE